MIPFNVPTPLSSFLEAYDRAKGALRDAGHLDTNFTVHDTNGNLIDLKTVQQGQTTIEDLVQGSVSVDNELIDDFILLRADGSPTYMHSVVIDDYDMGISHIIRGDDHLNNAFRQIQLFKAMNWKIPVFAHIPLIHGEDGSKLSKRHGALGVDTYRDLGYLPPWPLLKFLEYCCALLMAACCRCFLSS